MRKVKMLKLTLTSTMQTQVSARGENIGPGAGPGNGQTPGPKGGAGASGPREQSNQPGTKADTLQQSTSQGGNPLVNPFGGQSGPA